MYMTVKPNRNRFNLLSAYLMLISGLKAFVSASFVPDRNRSKGNYITYTYIPVRISIDYLRIFTMTTQLKLATCNNTGFGTGKPEYVSRLIDRCMILL